MSGADLARGRRIAATSVVVILLVSGVLAWATLQIPGRPWGPVGRYGIILIYCGYTWLGRRWARLLLGLFVLMGGIVAAIGGLDAGLRRADGLLSVAIAVVYVGAYLAMVMSRDAQRFFAAQGGRGAEPAHDRPAA